MMDLSLIKYVVVTLLLCGLVFLIHSNGRKVESADWLKEQNEYQQQLAKEIGDAIKRKSDMENAITESLARTINERDQELKKLETDMAAMRASNRGLYISAKACRGSSVSGKAESASKPDRTADTTGKIRLPGETEQNLYALAGDAQELVIRYDKLREACLPLVQVVQ
jgi:hypothetical protein